MNTQKICSAISYLSQTNNLLKKKKMIGTPRVVSGRRRPHASYAPEPSDLRTSFDLHSVCPDIFGGKNLFPCALSKQRSCRTRLKCRKEGNQGRGEGGGGVIDTKE